MSSWNCSKCTFKNPPSQKFACQICLSPQPTSFTSQIITKPKWSCQACTFLNKYDEDNCEICGSRASAALLSTVAEIDDLDELGSSVGDVFFPLRACSSNSKQTKRKIGENTDEDDVFDSGGGFRGLKAANKDFELVECLTAKDGSSQNTRSLKILSYNIWFNEDLEMQARMEALGDLIWEHRPDIMCFQEVTPDSYEMFQKSSWWMLYKCSVSKEMAIQNPYFCMQLCKLPVKCYSCKPFANSAMGRELCVAEVDIHADKTLVVATSHLESPCPGPPTWDQMYSKERVEQAKEAVRLLEKNPNVIFCGDMNWDDKLDGQFPFPDGWVDAWMELRPQEEGWTYDTKSNKMLSANRSLRKRLDRFICRLQDFKLSEIEMIGTEEIPGLSYCKEKKVKGQVKKITLPVLPSDHYGLLLTISPQ